MGKGGGTASTFWCGPRLRGDHCPFQKTETTALLQKWPPNSPPPPGSLPIAPSLTTLSHASPWVFLSPEGRTAEQLGAVPRLWGGQRRWALVKVGAGSSKSR